MKIEVPASLAGLFVRILSVDQSPDEGCFQAVKIFKDASFRPLAEVVVFAEFDGATGSHQQPSADRARAMWRAVIPDAELSLSLTSPGGSAVASFNSARAERRLYRRPCRPMQRNHRVHHVPLVAASPSKVAIMLGIRYEHIAEAMRSGN